MTLYTPSQPEVSPLAVKVTRHYQLMVWDDLDRVRTQQRWIHLEVTGVRGDSPRNYEYAMNGRPCTMTDAYWTLKQAQEEGNCEITAEEEVTA